MITGFGKIPAKADFIRIGHRDGATGKFERLLDEAWSRVLEAAKDTELSPVRFAFRPDGAPYAFIGIIRESRDSVGRRFPLTLGFVVPWHLVRSRWSALPVALAPFLEAVDGLLKSAEGLGFDELQRRAGLLRGPTDADIVALDGVCRRVLDETAWNSMAERLFSTETDGRSAYALHAALLACSQKSGELSIDCPIREDLDLFFWLELTRRFSNSEQVSFVWVEEENPRLIVSLGRAAQLPLRAIAHPEHQSSQIWPLETDRDSARRAALDKLGPVVTPVSHENAPLETLLQSLSRSTR